MPRSAPAAAESPSGLAIVVPASVIALAVSPIIARAQESVAVNRRKMLFIAYLARLR
jgi:hypothetical protein